jgi:hypothetical protein
MQARIFLNPRFSLVDAADIRRETGQRAIYLFGK